MLYVQLLCPSTEKKVPSLASPSDFIRDTQKRAAFRATNSSLKKLFPKATNCRHEKLSQKVADVPK